MSFPPEFHSEESWRLFIQFLHLQGNPRGLAMLFWSPCTLFCRRGGCEWGTNTSFEGRHSLWSPRCQQQWTLAQSYFVAIVPSARTNLISAPRTQSAPVHESRGLLATPSICKRKHLSLHLRNIDTSGCKSPPKCGNWWLMVMWTNKIRLMWMSTG